jgi:pyruvate dehydrogenase E1 component beta subunit
MRTAIRCGRPTVYLEHRRLYYKEGAVPQDAEYSVPFGKAKVVRTGSDITLVAWGWMREVAIAAAEQLAMRGIDAELIDLRSIVPMDLAAVVESTKKTSRLIVVEEATIRGSVGSELLASMAEALGDRALRMKRLGMPHAPHPYDHGLEQAMVPDAGRIVAAAAEMVRLPRNSKHGEPEWAKWSR